MASRRSARASVGKRLSYREESDQDDSTADLTEDEYQQDRASTSTDGGAVAEDEPSDEASEDSQAGKRRADAKRRKLNSVSVPIKHTAAKSVTIGNDWAPGETRVVAKLVGPPQTGHVARGELSRNVLDFLTDLQANNDRDWFARYDAVYRYCWKNFGEFADAVLNDIMEQVDDTVPWLPTKDLVYRIYRDVRFSNDKTPYKTNMMASFSRGGRKGPFAGYHVLIKPGGQSFFAAGRWQPEREDLAIIRRNILNDTQEARALKAAVSEPSFVKWFGAPKGCAKAKSKAKAKAQTETHQRCNLWGGDDQLKVAPKIEGVDKNHKDIDWLKLRSFCVIHHFSDTQVLRKDFRQRLVEAGKASEPLVRILNSMTSPDPPPPPETEDEADQDQDDERGRLSRDRNRVDLHHDDADQDELVRTDSFDYADDNDDANLTDSHSEGAEI